MIEAAEIVMIWASTMADALQVIYAVAEAVVDLVFNAVAETRTNMSLGIV